MWSPKCKRWLGWIWICSSIFQVLLKSVQWFCRCGWSKIALPHYFGQWLIQQLVLPYKLWCVPKTSPFLFFVIIIIIVVYYELSKRNWTRITQSKISRFQQFLEYGIPRKLATSRLVDYKFAHFTWEMSLQYLVKFSIIIVTSFLQKYKKMFEWRSKDIKQKLLCVCFLYNIFCLCYFYSQSYVLG